MVNYFVQCVESGWRQRSWRRTSSKNSLNYVVGENGFTHLLLLSSSRCFWTVTVRACFASSTVKGGSGAARCGGHQAREGRLTGWRRWHAVSASATASPYDSPPLQYNRDKIVYTCAIVANIRAGSQWRRVKPSRAWIGRFFIHCCAMHLIWPTSGVESSIMTTLAPCSTWTTLRPLSHSTLHWTYSTHSRPGHSLSFPASNLPFIWSAVR